MQVRELVQQLPPKVRRWVFVVFAMVALTIGALQVGFAAADVGQPLWLGVTLAVFTFVSAQVGFTAAQNVGAQIVDEDDDEGPVVNDYKLEP